MIALILAAEIIISGTSIILQPSDVPGAIAEVVMNNVSLNGPDDNGDYALAIDGLAVSVAFVWDAGEGGQDQITVTPPDGVLCQPSTCVLQLDEGADGRVILFEFVGF